MVKRDDAGTALYTNGGVISPQMVRSCQTHCIRGYPMDQVRKIWTRRAFISSLPKCCLKCHREGVLWTDRETIRESGSGCTTIIRNVAICMKSDCGAVFTQINGAEEGKNNSGFRCGRSEVIFVRSLPYHISLGGIVSEVLNRDNFAKPGRSYPQGVIDVARI